MTLFPDEPQYNATSAPSSREQAERAIAAFCALSEHTCLRVLAVSTTSLHGVPIGMAVLDCAGAVLIDTLIAADDPIDPEAAAVHGITASMLEGAPSLHDVYAQLRQLSAEPGAQVVTISPSFTAAAIRRGLPSVGDPRLVRNGWVDAGDLLRVMHGPWNTDKKAYGRVSLLDALRDAGVESGTMARRGTHVGNAQRLLALIHWHGAPIRAPGADSAPTA